MRWKRNVFLMLGLVMGIFWGIRQSEVTAFAAEQTGFRQKKGICGADPVHAHDHGAFCGELF